MVLAAALALAPAVRSEETGRKMSPEASDQLIKQQEQIIKEYQAFLDLLDKQVATCQDKETAKRVHDAIEYIRQADVDKKMDLIVKLLTRDEWVTAVAESLNVDADLTTFIKMVTGEMDKPYGDPGPTIEVLRQARDVAVDALNKTNDNPAKPYDYVVDLGKAIDEAGKILDRQNGLRGDLDNTDKPEEQGGKPPEKIGAEQTDLGTDTGNLRQRLENMGEPGKAAAAALGEAQANMGKAAGSASQAGPGNPQAKADAANAMQGAANNLKDAIAKMKDAQAAAAAETKKTGDLRTLSQREKEIADALKKAYDKVAGATSPNSGASQALKGAALKSGSAASKAGQAAQSGGKSGSGGAAGDQEDAKEELQKAIDAIEKEMARLEAIKALANVETALADMIKAQKEINDLTAAADVEGKAFEESNPGRPCEFTRATLLHVKQARAMEDDTAVRARMLQEVLADIHKIVFPSVFDELHGQMTDVIDKLAVPDVGDDTQYVQAQILTQLIWLKEAVHTDLQTLMEKEKQDQQGGGGGKQGGKDKDVDPLPSLAEIKMLRLMQVDVHLRTGELAQSHDRRIAAIDADNGLTPEARASMKKDVEEQQRMIGMRLAAQQSKIETLLRQIIENAQKRN
jgi:hypothetical protein